jgi:hypothetical protein
VSDARFNGPWGAGTRVLVRNTYPGTVSGHRGPSTLVKLDTPVSGQKVVQCDPAEIRILPPQPKHATCPFCPKVLANCGGGFRVGPRVICSSTGECFRNAQRALTGTKK